MNDAFQIDCPHCRRRIDVTGALSGPLLERLRGELLAQARSDAESRVDGRLRDLEAADKAKTQRLAEAQRHEQELRTKNAELEARAQEMELEVRRRVDAGRGEYRKKVQAEIEEENKLKDAERTVREEALRRQVEDLKRRLEQGSMQVQGEAQEVELEAALRSRFPHDVMEPVAKGVHGADVVQHVMLPGGVECGKILWEAKRTKAWSDGWVAKMKEDQRASRADVAVIVSAALPRDVVTFADVGGVWVTSRACAEALASALRGTVVALFETRRAAEGQQGKMEQVYKYLSGPDFRHRIEGIAEGFLALRKDLDSEKRAVYARWAARERHLDLVLRQTAGLSGDLSGIVGASAPAIPGFEPPALDPGSPEAACADERAERAPTH